MKTKINDIRTNLSNSIDLRGIIEAEKETDLINRWYLAEYTISEKAFARVPKLIIVLACTALLYILISIYTIMNTGAFYEPIDENIEACNRVYTENKDWVDSTYEHKNQNVVVRCATYMELIWQFESWNYKSDMCINQNNCYWIKGTQNWVYWFMTFKTRYQAKLYFAEKYLVWHGNNYFRGHKNRNIKQFVYNWSHTDQAVYTRFVHSRYWETFQYFTQEYIKGL